MNYCRVAPSLGELEGTHNEVWGTEDYSYDLHKYQDTVFFGLYDLRDYYALARHKGNAWVLWAGSDLRNLAQGFVFNDGKLHTLSKLFRGNWWVLPILQKAEHWVENDWERQELEKLGIRAHVCPSFMGNIEDYELSFSPGNSVYVSSGSSRQLEYGFGIVEYIAPLLPEIEFFLYGAYWDTKQPNIHVRGRVPKEKMNDEIKYMQCGLRLNSTDGFSEVTAKSALWGQYPISWLYNPHVGHAPNTGELVKLLREIPKKITPNMAARWYYREHLNKFPWNKYA